MLSVPFLRSAQFFPPIHSIEGDMAVSYTVHTVEKGKISYFGLARNLIRHLISPNQDDLSYLAQTFISGHQIGWAAKHTLFGWRTPTSADVTLAVLQ